MKASFLSIALLYGVSAFTSPTVRQTASMQRSKLLVGYVPDGLTEAQYKKIKEQERKTVQDANFGKLGPKGFKSRSLQAWQNAYEKGECSHAIAPIDYKKQLSRGTLKLKDIPYMVRGGSWDNSDVKGAKTLKWSKLDKEYAAGGYKKEQSASIIGSGPGLDWTGTQDRTIKRNTPGFS